MLKLPDKQLLQSSKELLKPTKELQPFWVLLNGISAKQLQHLMLQMLLKTLLIEPQLWLLLMVPHKQLKKLMLLLVSLHATTINYQDTVEQSKLSTLMEIELLLQLEIPFWLDPVLKEKKD
jgi:hypothetical protein